MKPKNMWWVLGGGLLLVAVIVIFFFIFSSNSVQVVGSDAVVVRAHPGEYKPGQVIVFKNAGTNTVITGYIVAIEGNGVYRTQRAANDTSGQQLVREDQILGQQVFSVPGVGWLVTYVQAVVHAVANGVSAVWQAVFGTEEPATVVTPESAADNVTPAEEAGLQEPSAGSDPTGTSSGAGPATTPTPVAATATPTPKVSATPTLSPIATATPHSTAPPVSQEELDAGFLTLPAPSPTP